MSPGDIVSRTREGVGLFDMAHRGLLEVRGADRVRWLDGMISGDVEALERAAPGAGCYAVLLTNRGAIIADLHVARFEERYLLESLRSEMPRIVETLERYVIADDVVLTDRSAEFASLGLEGPSASAVLEMATNGQIADLEPEQWAESTIGGRDVLVAGFGFSGECGFQIRMKPGDQEAVEEALAAAAKGDEGDGLVRGDFEALEILRIEAGLPALGSELDEGVLPPEARLERAISTSKGCYVGQEIVARLRARGQVNHLLVGLRLESPTLPMADTKLMAEGRVTGEVTSVALSPTEGPIALGFVRREHAETGTRIEFEGGRASIAALPFVAGLASVGAQTSGVT
jgi:folate-binding protein YgfZ